MKHKVKTFGRAENQSQHLFICKSTEVFYQVFVSRALGVINFVSICQ